MARIAKLKQEIMKAEQNGYKVFKVGGGLIAPENKNSNLYKALNAARQAGHEIVDYVVGAHRMRGTEGWEFAVIVK